MDRTSDGNGYRRQHPATLFRLGDRSHRYRLRPWITAPANGWSRSQNCSEQRADARGHRHGQCTPERDAYCAHRHACAACACCQPP